MKLKNKILYFVLVLAVLSNAIVHVFEIRNSVKLDNNLFSQEVKHYVDFEWTKDILRDHKLALDMLDYLIKKPDFEKLTNGTVIVSTKDEQSGSGVCIREDKNYYYILSANHVIVQSPNKITIKLVNDMTFSGEVIKTDTIKDLSLIRIAKSPYINLDVIKISENNPRLGETVFAIGHPLEFYYTLTEGIISNINNDKIISNITIMYGSSGCGLFNNSGELLGIVIDMQGHCLLTIKKEEIEENINIPIFTLTGSVRLESIKEFLKEYEEEKEAREFTEEVMKILRSLKI